MKYARIAIIIFLLTGFILNTFSVNLPDNREVLEKNFRSLEIRMVNYIVDQNEETKAKYLAYFKAYFQDRAVLNNFGEYETKIKENREAWKKLEAQQTNDWAEYTFNEFKMMCHTYMLIKLYKERYKLGIVLYSRYENRRGNGRILDQLEKNIYESYNTARSLYGELSGFLFEQKVLARNKAIYSIRRSYTTGSGSNQFEQHTLGSVIKMLDVYKGKFSNLKPGVMVHLAKYQLRSSEAQTATGFAIILNFAPIEKSAVINKVKKVELKVSAASGLELIKELFNSASEQMVAIATIEMLQTTLSTRQWQMAGISMKDIVASKAFILGFKVLSKRKFKQTIGGQQRDMLEATVEATIGLPKLSEISFAPAAAGRLETYRQMVRQNRQQQQPAQPGASAPVTPPAQTTTGQETPAPQQQQTPAPVQPTERQNQQPPVQQNGELQSSQTPETGNRTGANAVPSGNRTSNHPDLDADLPDVERRSRFYKPEGPPESSF